MKKPDLAALAGAVVSAVGDNDEIQGVQTWLDTGYKPLNKALSGDYDGGIPVGRIIEIYGGESCGKTALATSAMKSAQEMGGVAMFNDHERSFDVSLATGMGLDDTPGPWIFKTPDTFEASVTNTIKVAKAIREGELIDPAAPICVVFDSLASMIPQSKFAKEVTEQGMNDSLALSKACSSIFPTLALMAEKYQMAILILNQVREKPGVMYGDPTTTPGGRAPKFYASIRVSLSRSMIVDKSGGEKTTLGQEVKANVIKNKCSAPFKSAQWRFMFREDGSGYFDYIHSTLEHLVKIGVIPSAGARIEWDGSKLYKKQVAAKLMSDPEGLAKLEAMLPKGEEDLETDDESIELAKLAEA